jgi:predicted Zn-dependent protease with MMP-like domain
MGRDEFELVVSDALDDLPRELTRLMDNVAIFVEDDPPPGQYLLGLYVGVPLTQRTTSYALAMPDRIMIYRRPILNVCRDHAEVRRQVQSTVAHEIAHHFGIDDERLAALGYA